MQRFNALTSSSARFNDSRFNASRFNVPTNHVREAVAARPLIRTRIRIWNNPRNDGLGSRRFLTPGKPSLNRLGDVSADSNSIHHKPLMMHEINSSLVRRRHAASEDERNV